MKRGGTRIIINLIYRQICFRVAARFLIKSRRSCSVLLTRLTTSMSQDASWDGKKYWEFIMGTQSAGDRLTEKQRSARMAAMFDLMFQGKGLTRAEGEMFDHPYNEWDEALKAKIGPLARTIAAEDEAAAKSQPPVQ